MMAKMPKIQHASSPMAHLWYCFMTHYTSDRHSRFTLNRAVLGEVQLAASGSPPFATYNAPNAGAVEYQWTNDLVPFIPAVANEDIVRGGRSPPSRRRRRSRQRLLCASRLRRSRLSTAAVSALLGVAF
jgi:hypothetical protein